MFQIDWRAMFVPGESLLELILRGTVMYFTIFVLLRFVIRRHVGGLEMSDLLMLVLIADAAQNGMAGEYKSITGGVVLCGTIIVWSWLLDVAGYHWKWAEKLTAPPAIPVIRYGKVNRHALRREFISEESLESHLRQQGVDDYADVKLAFIEPDGQISVVRYTKTQEKPKTPEQKKIPGVD